jgi:hypothetical protein
MSHHILDAIALQRNEINQLKAEGSQPAPVRIEGAFLPEPGYQVSDPRVVQVGDQVEMNLAIAATTEDAKWNADEWKLAGKLTLVGPPPSPSIHLISRLIYDSSVGPTAYVRVRLNSLPEDTRVLVEIMQLPYAASANDPATVVLGGTITWNNIPTANSQ